MYQLYPAIKPYDETSLQVSSRHLIFISQYGDPEGIPVVVLHGGPGGGRSARASQLFDPEKYRIIQFDQRGCGKSTPYGELEENDANLLIQDIDTIRKHLQIEQWIVAGGSWGAQLALRYSFSHANHVSALILRCPFLGRQQDLEWRFAPQGGAAQIFPDHYLHFTQQLPQSIRHDPILGYHQLFNSSNEFEQLNAARHWSVWKGGLSHLLPLKDAQSRFGFTKQALALARIENHYYRHSCFMPENFIIENIEKIKDLPAIIIHGRYDMVCKLEGSQALVGRWPNAQLQIVPGAGHSGGEAGMVDAFIQASNNIALWLY